MKNLFITLLLALTIFPLNAANDRLALTGRVKDAVTKMDLTDAKILWYDADGNVSDTIECKGKRYVRREVVNSSDFYIPITRQDSTYVFDVICDRYNMQTITVEVTNPGRKQVIEVPTIYLSRAPKQLDEVTVTSSKIKFYNKGDTIVFNADAFQLAEGSMLDGLISQLPGVELNDDGQIKINGEFVESLLLNGKDFLDGNNQLMLDNIAAYTVKDVEVYRGQSSKEKWMRDISAPSHLIMNVQLKKEYNMGTILNAQAGVGTDSRYTGRLFASWFNATSRLSLMGNINNLNDNRKPGKSDTWTPDMMPSGTRQYRMGSVDYVYANPEETVEVSANAIFEQTRTHDLTTTSTTNFLSSGNTFENSYNRAHTVDTRFNTKDYLRLRNERISGYLDLSAYYRRKSNDSEALAGSFKDEQQEMTRDLLKAIYTDGSPAAIESIINRSETRTDGSSRQADIRLTPGVAWTIPGSNDQLCFEFYNRYNSTKEERWRDYTVNYGANPVPTDRRRQYFDDSPNHLFTSVNNITYRMSIGDLHLSLNYEYRFSDHEKDSYMFALERLSDMGAYGVLPAGYLDTFDPANSYTSRMIENKHSVCPSIMYFYGNERMRGSFYINPNFSLKHQHLDYWRDQRSYLVKQTNYIVTAGNYDMMMMFKLSPYTDSRGRRSFKNSLEYRCRITPTTPDPFDRVDVVNDSDPLNITSGNPDLKTSYLIGNSVEWGFTPGDGLAHPMMNRLSLEYDITTNELTRGYTYNTTTGVRHTRTYNVNGNSVATLDNSFSLQFGRRNQFELSSGTSASLTRSADMIGIDLDLPTRSRVNTSMLSEKLTFAWTLGKQTLSARASVTSRRTTSPRVDFSAINARHFTYGLTGNFRLPAGWGISTDLTAYTRRGYGVKQLDTSDVVWNMRVSYCPPRASRWVFMLDGFDMLHQLSNVNYAVNAAGRTVSYSNTLPRYIMLSVQYRLNIKPKKH